MHLSELIISSFKIPLTVWPVSDSHLFCILDKASLAWLSFISPQKEPSRVFWWGTCGEAGRRMNNCRELWWKSRPGAVPELGVEGDHWKAWNLWFERETGENTTCRSGDYWKEIESSKQEGNRKTSLQLTQREIAPFGRSSHDRGRGGCGESVLTLK